MVVEGNSNSYGQAGVNDGGFFESLISEISSRNKDPLNYSFGNSSKSTARTLHVNGHLVYDEAKNMVLNRPPEPQPRIGANYSSHWQQSQSVAATESCLDIYTIEALTRLSKKPRPDSNTEDTFQHQNLHFGKSLVELQEKNSELKALLEHQRQQNQLHRYTSLSGIEQQAVQAEVADRISYPPSFDGNICTRRLMQYLFHLRRRPIHNDISYWRKFSSDYYAPCVKKRWCLSICENISEEALSLFTETATESWCCSICGSKSSKGFEVIYEALPMLFKTKFESGMLDEIIFLGLPQEHVFPSGLIMLEYGKVVQESVYETFRIVHEGKLRVIFRNDLKIVFWEFCAQCHEELLQHKLITREIDHFVEAAQQYRSTVNNFGEALSKDIQSCCNMFVTAGKQLARNVQLPLVNDLGFSRKHFRCLQIAEVVSTMKELINTSQELGVGPIECLKKYGELKEVKETMSSQSVVTGSGSEEGWEVGGDTYSQLLKNDSYSSTKW